MNNNVTLTPDTELRINFDKETGDITISSVGGNTIVLSDSNKEVVIKDVNDNSVVMSASGISLKSPKNISIEAGQKVTIAGNCGVDIQASSGDVVTNAINIKESADVQFSAEGSATASVQGGAELTLKGAMVMIN